MAKSKVLCAHCDAKLTTQTAFCPKCTQPTMFASAEERTAWELEQWSKKRGTTPKRSVARAAEPHIAKPAARPKRETKVEQPVVSHEPAAMNEPIKRVQMPKTIHPAVARARQKAAPMEEPVSPPEEKRVIVLDEPVAKEPPREVSKKPARAPKKAAPAAAAPKPAAAAPKKELAERPKRKTAPRKAPMMALMPVEMPATRNGNGNGHVADATAEQTEILRELLRRVTAIEEKMTAPRARRFGWRKR